jgi:hypothetical protein
MASGEKAKGKERITDNGWQVVVAKGRKRSRPRLLPAWSRRNKVCRPEPRG